MIASIPLGLSVSLGNANYTQAQYAPGPGISFRSGFSLAEVPNFMQAAKQRFTLSSLPHSKSAH